VLRPHIVATGDGSATAALHGDYCGEAAEPKTARFWNARHGSAGSRDSKLFAPNGQVRPVDEAVAIRVATGQFWLNGSSAALPSEEIGSIDEAVAVEISGRRCRKFKRQARRRRD
jgi:hypothetical protein